MHIAVLMANTDDSDFARAHPGDGAKFEALLQELRPEWRVSVYAVKDGIFPPTGAVHDGWIITGSPASVHDDMDWIGRLQVLIRDLAGQGQPLFGACFGHQAIAKALGGVVGDNPGGWEFGLVETVLEGEPMRLYAAHREQVVGLPPGAVGLGGNAGCPVGGCAIGRVLTTQYHPEMTPDFVAALVEEYGPKLPKAVALRAAASLAVQADRAAIVARMVRFFEGG